MGLTACPDCKKEVSDIAPTCPNCGRPLKNLPSRPDEEKTSPVGVSIVTCGIIGFVIGLIFLFKGCVAGPDDTSTIIVCIVLALFFGIFGAFLGLGIGLIMKKIK